MAKPRKSYGLWVTGIVLRGLLGAALLALFLFLFWRVFFSGRMPADMRRLAPNETLAAAYRADGDLSLFRQEQATVTKVDGYNYGYFAVPRCVFIENAGQVQAVFRYNNSTLKNVARDLGLDAALPRGEEVFDVTLVVARGEGDDLAYTRVSPSSATVDTTALYTYFLYTFDGVFLDDTVRLVDLDVYYPKDGADYSADSRGTLRLYDAALPRRAVRLSARERRALERFS